MTDITKPQIEMVMAICAAYECGSESVFLASGAKPPETYSPVELVGWETGVARSKSILDSQALGLNNPEIDDLQAKELAIQKKVVNLIRAVGKMGRHFSDRMDVKILACELKADLNLGPAEEEKCDK